MQERLHAAQSSDLAPGQSLLFFGSRRADQDYLYGQQLEQWAEQGFLTLSTAFSRQQVATHSSTQVAPVCVHGPLGLLCDRYSRKFLCIMVAWGSSF